jgi:hypothetical protein
MGDDNPFLPNGVSFRLLPDASGPPADSLLMPGYVPLDSVLLVGDAVTPLSPERRVAGWAPFVSGDSIYLGIGDGFSGVSLLLKVHGDTLIGYGRSTTDFPAVSWRKRVTAHRTPCS